MIRNMPTLDVSDSYTPLAGYGPEIDLAIRETLFAPDVTAERLLNSSRDTTSSRSWPGFRFLLLMHDGHQARALSFWNNRRVLNNFIERHEAANREYIATQDTNNPWVASIESRKVGESDMHLVDASMPALDGEVVIWSPPGAVRICEIENTSDISTLREWWPMIASPRVPDSLVEVAGFQFFSAIQYPDNCYTTYLGFKSQSALDDYLASDLHAAHDGPFASPEFRRQVKVTAHTGQLIAWFQRRIS